jgi:hypothetical protein
MAIFTQPDDWQKHIATVDDLVSHSATRQTPEANGTENYE